MGNSLAVQRQAQHASGPRAFTPNDSFFALSAARSGDTDVLRMFLMKNQALAWATAHDGSNPWHIAAVEGHTEALVLLAQVTAMGAVSNNFNPTQKAVNQVDGHGRTPLMLACRGGHYSCAKLLLEVGAEWSTADEHGHTALHHAALAPSGECVQLLLKQAGLWDPDGSEHTEDPKAMTFVNHGDAQYGRTALHLAAWSGQLEGVEALVASGARVHMQTLIDCYESQLPCNQGTTPLHLAAMKGHQRVVVALLEAWVKQAKRNPEVPDPRLILDNYGNTPFKIAADRRHDAPLMLQVLNPATIISELQRAQRRRQRHEARQTPPPGSPAPGTPAKPHPEASPSKSRTPGSPDGKATAGGAAQEAQTQANSSAPTSPSRKAAQDGTGAGAGANQGSSPSVSEAKAEEGAVSTADTAKGAGTATGQEAEPAGPEGQGAGTAPVAADGLGDTEERAAVQPASGDAAGVVSSVCASPSKGAAAEATSDGPSSAGVADQSEPATAATPGKATPQATVTDDVAAPAQSVPGTPGGPSRAAPDASSPSSSGSGSDSDTEDSDADLSDSEVLREMDERLLATPKPGAPVVVSIRQMRRLVAVYDTARQALVDGQGRPLAPGQASMNGLPRGRARSGSSQEPPRAQQLKQLSSTPVPDHYLCPLTCRIFRDPVVAADGYSYEREAIEQHLAAGRLVSPVAGRKLPSTVLYANHTLQAAVDAWKSQHMPEDKDVL